MSQYLESILMLTQERRKIETCVENLKTQGPKQTQNRIVLNRMKDRKGNYQGNNNFKKWGKHTSRKTTERQ